MKKVHLKRATIYNGLAMLNKPLIMIEKVEVMQDRSKNMVHGFSVNDGHEDLNGKLFERIDIKDLQTNNVIVLSDATIEFNPSDFSVKITSGMLDLKSFG